jgi:hypothetical protein
LALARGLLFRLHPFDTRYPVKRSLIVLLALLSLATGCTRRGALAAAGTLLVVGVAAAAVADLEHEAERDHERSCGCDRHDDED